MKSATAQPLYRASSPSCSSGFAGLVAFALVMWRIAINRMEARLID